MYCTGPDRITNLGQSHLYQINKDGSGYYTHVVLPENWLFNMRLKAIL